MTEPWPKVLVILGPTGVGKTKVSLEVADRLEGEIVCADSRQIYRLMDIGTAKPKPEERRRTVHHLIDIVDPDQKFTAADFADQAKMIIRDLIERKKIAIVVGGTGLYVRALTKGFFKGPRGDTRIRERLSKRAREKGKEFLHKKLSQIDPEAAKRIHPNNLIRVIRALEVYELTGVPISQLQKSRDYQKKEFDFVKVGLNLDRRKLYENIEKRVDKMMAEGLLQEVKKLDRLGYSRDLSPLKTLGYKELFSYLDGDLSLAEAVDMIKKNTRNYAKRQITWFNKENDLVWFDADLEGLESRIVEKFRKNP